MKEFIRGEIDGLMNVVLVEKYRHVFHQPSQDWAGWSKRSPDTILKLCQQRADVVLEPLDRSFRAPIAGAFSHRRTFRYSTYPFAAALTDFKSIDDHGAQCAFLV